MSRSPRRLLLAAAAGLACIVLAPAAQAGGHGPNGYGYGPDRYGATGDWSSAEEICRQVEGDAAHCHWSHSEGRVEQDRIVEDDGVRPVLYEAVNVPDSFFNDYGGVGVAFADYGGSSGGGFVYGGAFAGASAFASARVSVGVSVHGGGGFGFHGGGRPPMGHGCGCGGGGHHW